MSVNCLKYQYLEATFHGRAFNPVFALSCDNTISIVTRCRQLILSSFYGALHKKFIFDWYFSSPYPQVKQEIPTLYLMNAVEGYALLPLEQASNLNLAISEINNFEQNNGLGELTTLEYNEYTLDNPADLYINYYEDKINCKKLGRWASNWSGYEIKLNPFWFKSPPLLSIFLQNFRCNLHPREERPDIPFDKIPFNWPEMSRNWLLHVDYHSSSKDFIQGYTGPSCLKSNARIDYPYAQHNEKIIEVTNEWPRI